MKRTLLLDIFTVLVGLVFLALCIFAQNFTLFDIEALLKLTH